MLQAARALMFSKGYRPAGNNQHATVVQFSGQFLNTESVDALTSWSMTWQARYRNWRQKTPSLVRNHSSAQLRTFSADGDLDLPLSHADSKKG